MNKICLYSRTCHHTDISATKNIHISIVSTTLISYIISSKGNDTAPPILAVLPRVRAQLTGNATLKSYSKGNNDTPPILAILPRVRAQLTGNATLKSDSRKEIYCSPSELPEKQSEVQADGIRLSRDSELWLKTV